MQSPSNERPARGRISYRSAVQSAGRQSCVTGCMAVAILASAVGQAADLDTDQGSLEQVVITGSRIQRTDTDTPAPVQVITSEQIANSGYTSISDVLHALTANDQGNLNQSFNGSFAAGGAGGQRCGPTRISFSDRQYARRDGRAI